MEAVCRTEREDPNHEQWLTVSARDPWRLACFARDLSFLVE
jgi:hypothetical protein